MKNKILFLIITITSLIFCSSCNEKKNDKIEAEPISIVNDVKIKCKGMPIFPANYGLSSPYNINLALQKLTLVGARGRKLHLKEWERPGQVGIAVYDAKGNIFLNPRPFVNDYVNKQDEQNKIYKINSSTGEISIFIEFDNKGNSTNNPFGVMDIKIDCSNNIMYACSVYGSDYNHEKGIIYAIDLATKKVIDKIENIDAVSLQIANTKTGKKLYFGNARQPHLSFVKLKDNGKFASHQPVAEIKIEDFDNSMDENIVDISFVGKDVSFILVPFVYSMFGATDPNRNIFIFSIDNGKWALKKKTKLYPNQK